jgi:pathogenesis-related protein 1
VYAVKSIDHWYRESKSYDYKVGQSILTGKNVDNFTQLMWKDSTEIGFGMAASTTKDKNGNYWLFIVAYFTPPGNVKGEYLNNVFAPT